MDWVHLAQDWDKWYAAVNMLMKLWVPHNVGNFLTRQETVGWNWQLFKEDSAVYSQLFQWVGWLVAGWSVGWLLTHLE